MYTYTNGYNYDDEYSDMDNFYGCAWDRELELTRIDEMLSFYDYDGEFILVEEEKRKPEPEQGKLRGERSYYALFSQLNYLLCDRRAARTHNDGPPGRVTFTKRRMKKIERRHGKKILSALIEDNSRGA